MYFLNKKEENIMFKMWELNESDIFTLKKYINLPYTTIASILKRLEVNGFCIKEKYPFSNKYYYRILIDKEQYANIIISYFLRNYFD